MRIILNEIKKIFNLKSCIILLIGTFLIYNLFIEFNIENFPNGRPTLDNYNIAVKMIEDYGHEMDDAEFIEFQNVYEEKISEADKYLSNNVEFNKYGIYSYEDYNVAREYKYSNDDGFNELFWANLNSEDGNRFWELQEMPGMIGRYIQRDDYSIAQRGESQIKRIEEIRKNQEYNSILPWVVFDNYDRLIKGFATSIIIGIAFMLMPIFVKDKRGKLESLQYSSKIGRLLFKSKLIAGFISAMIITTVELIVYMILYSGNNTSMFFKSNINSMFNREFWFSMTFIQYIILTVVCVYILSLIIALISMFVSSKVRNYVSAIGVQVPVVFILCGLTSVLLLNYLTNLYTPKYLALGVFIILILISVLIIYNSNKKENIKPIVD